MDIRFKVVAAGRIDLCVVGNDSGIIARHQLTPEEAEELADMLTEAVWTARHFDVRTSR